MVVNNWIAANLIWITLAIAIVVLIYLVFTIIQTIRKKRRFVSQLSIILLILGLMFLIFLTYHANEIEGKDWGQIILMLGLVIVTALYASSTEKQANASVKMAEEMREQRIMSSRPIIVQKDVHGTDQETGIIWELFSWFEIYNAGNSPAIRLEILLLDKEKKLLEKWTDPVFLRAAKSVKISPSSLVSHVGSTCYLLCQYQGVFSHDKGQKWYQTWFSFEPIKSIKSQKPQRGDIIIKPGELQFCEVSEKESY